MKKLSLNICIVIVLAVIRCTQNQMSNQEYVARYKGIFTQPAQKVPTKTVPDGPISGNGDVGIVIGGKPGPWRSDFANGDINPTSSLGYLHMFYKGIIDVSNFLNNDADKHDKWNHILTHLSPIPIEEKDGMIRVFPAWLTNKDAKFKTLRAYGAFLVSSEIKNGKIVYIKITSEKGRICTLENPWDNARVVLERNGQKAETFMGKLIKFETKINESISVKPI